MKKLRMIYGALFVFLLSAEIFIALFVKDQWIRPYVGDVLVTVLLCCFGRIFFPAKVRLLPLYVCGFSFAVEILQAVDFVKLLRLEQNPVFSVVFGRTFSSLDLVCYAAGCVVFFLLDRFLIRRVIPLRCQ